MNILPLSLPVHEYVAIYEEKKQLNSINYDRKDGLCIKHCQWLIREKPIVAHFYYLIVCW